MVSAWQYCWIFSHRKILTCLLPFLTFLLKVCLPLEEDTTSPKLEKASLTAWSLMWSGRRIVTKIGFFPFLRGPTHFWKFKIAGFDPRAKTNFEGETLYRASISVTPSDSRIRKRSDFFFLCGHESSPSSENAMGISFL